MCDRKSSTQEGRQRSNSGGLRPENRLTFLALITEEMSRNIKMSPTSQRHNGAKLRFDMLNARAGNGVLPGHHGTPSQAGVKV
jgi:hypothetical protein